MYSLELDTMWSVIFCTLTRCKSLRSWYSVFFLIHSSGKDFPWVFWLSHWFFSSILISVRIFFSIVFLYWIQFSFIVFVISFNHIIASFLTKEFILILLHFKELSLPVHFQALVSFDLVRYCSLKESSKWRTFFEKLMDVCGKYLAFSFHIVCIFANPKYVHFSLYISSTRF